MSKNLVIVESPAKAKTLSKFLGSDYDVRASVGHVSDLPSKGLNIDVDNGFKPTYELTDRGKDVVKDLRKALKDVPAVEALVRRGKTLQDAREGGCSGCIEVGAFGKEAFVLPGRVTDRQSWGALRLIQDGAKLVCSPAEIVAEVVRGVREEIGPVASFQRACVVERLPKTRSGKIMRRLLRDIAEGRTPGDTTTLADPGVVDNLIDNRENK